MPQDLNELVTVETCDRGQLQPVTIVTNLAQISVLRVIVTRQPSKDS